MSWSEPLTLCRQCWSPTQKKTKRQLTALVGGSGLARGGFIEAIKGLLAQTQNKVISSRKFSEYQARSCSQLIAGFSNRHNSLHQTFLVMIPPQLPDSPQSAAAGWQHRLLLPYTFHKYIQMHANM